MLLWFSEDNYEWKNISEESVEFGIYSFDAANSVMEFTPVKISFITQNSDKYKQEVVIKQKDLELTYQKVDTLIKIYLKKNCL